MGIQQMLLTGVELFIPLSRTYTGPAGSSTETVPAGATACTVAIWSGGASGSHVASGVNTGGGGSGGYQQLVGIAVSGGQTFTYVLGGGGAPASLGNPGASDSGSIVSNGTVVLPFSLGDLGGVAQGGGTGGSGGAGAIMGSSGTTNTNGNAGTGGVISGKGGDCPGGGGAGGLNSATTQDPGGTPGGGGGGSVSTASGAGGPAQVKFSYT